VLSRGRYQLPEFVTALSIWSFSSSVLMSADSVCKGPLSPCRRCSPLLVCRAWNIWALLALNVSRGMFWYTTRTLARL
jgi:hypothetical protein